MDFNVDVASLSLMMVFMAGLVAGFSPCTLPTVVLITGYVGGYAKDKSRGFVLTLSFIMGIITSLSLLGVVAVAVGNIFLGFNGFNYLVAAILIMMGLWLMKIFHFNISAFMPFKVKQNSGILGAYILGLPFGILASPCTVPILGGVLAYVATVGKLSVGFGYLFVFAVARSLPLLVVGTFAGMLKNISKFGQWQERIEYFAGIIMIMTGLYFIWIA